MKPMTFHGVMLEITQAAELKVSTAEFDALHDRIVKAGQTGELNPIQAYLLLSCLAINRTDREA